MGVVPRTRAKGKSVSIVRSGFGTESESLSLVMSLFFVVLFLQGYVVCKGIVCE